jgi:hypothetical protein
VIVSDPTDDRPVFDSQSMRRTDQRGPTCELLMEARPTADAAHRAQVDSGAGFLTLGLFSGSILWGLGLIDHRGQQLG